MRDTRISPKYSTVSGHKKMDSMRNLLKKRKETKSILMDKTQEPPACISIQGGELF